MEVGVSCYKTNYKKQRKNKKSQVEGKSQPWWKKGLNKSKIGRKWIGQVWSKGSVVSTRS